jgi:hypothetical protein
MALCDFKSACLRALLMPIDSLFFGLVAYLHMKPPQYQRIGDEVAKTIVIGAQDPIAPRRRAWKRFALAAGLYMALAGVGTTIGSLIAFR